MLFFVSLLPGCSVPGRPFSEHKKKTCDNLAVKLYHKEKDPSTVLTDLSLSYFHFPFFTFFALYITL